MKIKNKKNLAVPLGALLIVLLAVIGLFLGGFDLVWIIIRNFIIGLTVVLILRFVMGLAKKRRSVKRR